MVAKFAVAVVLIEVAQQLLGKVEGVLVAGGLQRMVYVGCQAVAGGQWAENLVVVELALVAVVNYALEAEGSLLPDEAVYGGAVSEGGDGAYGTYRTFWTHSAH